MLDPQTKTIRFACPLFEQRVGPLSFNHIPLPAAYIHHQTRIRTDSPSQNPQLTESTVYEEDYDRIRKEYAEREALKEKEELAIMFREAKDKKKVNTLSPEGTVVSNDDCTVSFCSQNICFRSQYTFQPTMYLTPPTQKSRVFRSLLTKPILRRLLLRPKNEVSACYSP